MCRAVAEALATKRHLVVQAGTGTGKSLAYLVPAALSGQKVVVATATKALQDQLAGKDLPLLEAGLGLPVPLDYAVLKGRSNYLCRQRVLEVGSGGVQPELGDQRPGGEDAEDSAASGGAGAGGGDDGAPPEGLVEEVRRLVTWAQTSPTGDRADLRFEPSDRAWNMVSVGPRECPGAFNCPSGGQCFAEAARDRAAAADIVVVNTHLYGAHLASGRVVLPEHDVVVFDEAHELEEVMTASLGVEVTAGRVRALVTSARALVDERDRELCETLGDLGDQLGDLVIDRVGTRVLDDRGRLSAEDRSLSDVLVRADDVSRRLTDALRRSGDQGSLLDGGEVDPDRGSRKTRTVQAAAHLAEDLHRLVHRTDTHVAWVDGTRRNARLRLSPIDVGPALAGLSVGEVTSVLTSATIPPRLVERVGLESFATEELNVGQPVRLPRPCAALRGPPPARPAGRGRRGGAARGAGAAHRRGGRAHPGPLHQPAGHRGGRRGAGPRAALHRADPGRPAQGPAARGVRRGRDLVPLRHPRLLAGGRHPRPRPLAGHHRQAALPPPRRPAAPGPARPGRRAGLPAGRPPPGGHHAGAGRGPAHPHGRRPGRGGGARPAPGHGLVPGVLLSTLPPMRRSVDRDEVEVFLAAGARASRETAQS